MKILKILSNLITEDSKYDFLNKKYVLPSGGKDKGILPFDIFKQLIFTDPETKYPENFDIDGASSEDMSKLVKAGPYVEWIIKQFIQPKLTDENTNEPLQPKTEKYKSKIKEYWRLFLEDLPETKLLLTKYHRFKGSLVDASKKDINRVSSIKELAHLPVKYGEEEVELALYRGKKIKKEKGTEANLNFRIPGAEILKVGSEYTLIRISDKGELGSKAASYFGGYDGGLDRGETNWCTAATNSKWSHDYRQQGPLYIFIANDDKGKVGQVTGLPSERYQIHFPTNQFRYSNQHGGNIPIVEYLNGKWSEFKEILKPEFIGGFMAPNTENVTITYPGDKTSIFIALYGFDELFNILPDNIKELHLLNRSNQNITLEVPESISKFKNLVTINFENFIKSLPNSICQLKGLEYIAITKCQELETLPECIKDLDELVFINLKDSNNNVNIPQKLRDVLDYEGDGFYTRK